MVVIGSQRARKQDNTDIVAQKITGTPVAVAIACSG